ncbi:hypothetical protein V6N13_070556 [Hibiscus sabdariffa]|uniref:Uncharacterized protein n=1 Tax=Hibiscus sabdariffa TaxID=183260 RepID=A0ABR2TGY3_9ROSI
MVQKAELSYLRTRNTTLNRRLIGAWASVRQYANQERDARYKSALRRVTFYRYLTQIKELHIKDLKEVLGFLESELAGKTEIQVRTSRELTVVKRIHRSLRWRGRIRNRGQTNADFNAIQQWCEETDGIVHV